VVPREPAGAGHPRQYEFSRLNLNYTITSKRKLKQLVDEKHVNGWDDPRMSTLSGFRRRGYTPASIRNFCEMIGTNRSDGVVDFGMLEFSIRDDLDQRPARHVRAASAESRDHQLPGRPGREPRTAASSERRHGRARPAVRP
jgi:glutamyl/glutaminyl-tRNA synthetase